jgi:hypothetical protein
MASRQISRREKDMRKIGFIVTSLLLVVTAACGGGDKDRDEEVRANNGLGVASQRRLVSVRTTGPSPVKRASLLVVLANPQ